VSHRGRGHGGGDPWPASQWANAKSQNADVVRIDKTGVASEDAREDARAAAGSDAGTGFGTGAWDAFRSAARTACGAVECSDCGVVLRDDGGADCGSARGGQLGPGRVQARPVVDCTGLLPTPFPRICVHQCASVVLRAWDTIRNRRPDSGHVPRRRNPVMSPAARKPSQSLCPGRSSHVYSALLAESGKESSGNAGLCA